VTQECESNWSEIIPVKAGYHGHYLLFRLLQLVTEFIDEADGTPLVAITRDPKISRESYSLFLREDVLFFNVLHLDA
jgi:hypothetical protein